LIDAGPLESVLEHIQNDSYHVAARRIDKDLLHDLIEAVIMETIDGDEELKLRLLAAIQAE
jgi:death on curing protein